MKSKTVINYSVMSRYLFAIDVVSWFGAIVLAGAARYDFKISPATLGHLAIFALLAIAVHTLVALAFKLYRHRSKVATFEELQTLLWSSVVTGVALTLLLLAFGNMWQVPRATALVATPLFVFFAGASRSVIRRSQTPGKINTDKKGAIIFGAGAIANALVPQLTNDPKSEFLPVALLDDSEAKSRLWINGVQVMGGWKDVRRVANQTNAQVVIVCIANVDATLLSKIENDSRKVGLSVMVLPSLEEVLQGHYGIRDLKKLSIEDIIGRRTSVSQFSTPPTYLKGKRVLVTGAGGSIGIELCRQIARLEPSKLYILDRDETGLQQAQIAITGHGLLNSDEVILCDIRESDVLEAIMEDIKPEVVFHAAALKHLPVLENFPDEAWKTNVLGTLNVLRASQKVGVQTFINISTDKAADASSILGKSKKIAEGLTSWFAKETRSTYLSVRFGNVLGSRGSLIPTFASLIENGGPLTITHPEVTRFFMTIPEACQLVIQAGSLGRPQDVLILDMGKPVKILDIANKMIEISNRKIEIVFTGLRPGEKLHEELFGENETGEILSEGLISRSFVPETDPQSLDRSQL